MWPISFLCIYAAKHEKRVCITVWVYHDYHIEIDKQVTIINFLEESIGSSTGLIIQIADYSFRGAEMTNGGGGLGGG